LVSSGRKGCEDEGDEGEKEGEARSVATGDGELRVKMQHANCHSHSVNGSGLTCVYFNAQSIMNKLDDLHTMTCSLQPDIVGISESWTNCNILYSELAVAGYETFRCDRPNSHKGGGVVAVMLYVSRKSPSVVLTVIKWYRLIAVTLARTGRSPETRKRVCTTYYH